MHSPKVQVAFDRSAVTLDLTLVTQQAPPHLIVLTLPSARAKLI